MRRHAGLTPRITDAQRINHIESLQKTKRKGSEQHQNTGKHSSPTNNRPASSGVETVIGAIQSAPSEPEATEDVQAVMCAYFALMLDGYRNCLYFPWSSSIPSFSIQRFLFVHHKSSYAFFIKFFQSQVRAAFDSAVIGH